MRWLISKSDVIDMIRSASDTKSFEEQVWLKEPVFTEDDLDELEIRFGKECRDVVLDMINGTQKRFENCDVCEVNIDG